MLYTKKKKKKQINPCLLRLISKLWLWPGMFLCAYPTEQGCCYGPTALSTRGPPCCHLNSGPRTHIIGGKGWMADGTHEHCLTPDSGDTAFPLGPCSQCVNVLQLFPLAFHWVLKSIQPTMLFKHLTLVCEPAVSSSLGPLAQ